MQRRHRHRARAIPTNVRTHGRNAITHARTQGGDLLGLLSRMSLPILDEHIHFYAGSIILGFRHLHSHRFVFRDLKPQVRSMRANARVRRGGGAVVLFPHSIKFGGATVISLSF